MAHLRPTSAHRSLLATLVLLALARSGLSASLRGLQQQQPQPSTFTICLSARRTGEALATDCSSLAGVLQRAAAAPQWQLSACSMDPPGTIPDLPYVPYYMFYSCWTTSSFDAYVSILESTWLLFHPTQPLPAVNRDFEVDFNRYYTSHGIPHASLWTYFSFLPDRADRMPAGSQEAVGAWVMAYCTGASCLLKGTPPPSPSPPPPSPSPPRPSPPPPSPRPSRSPRSPSPNPLPSPATSPTRTPTPTPVRPASPTPTPMPTPTPSPTPSPSPSSSRFTWPQASPSPSPSPRPPVGKQYVYDSYYVPDRAPGMRVGERQFGPAAYPIIVVLDKEGSVMNGAGIGPSGEEALGSEPVAAEPFFLSTSTNNASWIMAARDETWVKMIRLQVTVVNGWPYIYASAAGWCDESYLPPNGTLTRDTVVASWNRRRPVDIAICDTCSGYGISRLSLRLLSQAP